MKDGCSSVRWQTASAIRLYNSGIEAGALGGKLLGAGGAGFVLFYCPEEKQAAFREKMSAYTEMPFKFENYGSKIIYMNE